ncbi:16S rRNA (cytosine(1402)-N(4))-methyltransferase RsmH [Bacteroidota bacterium]
MAFDNKYHIPVLLNESVDGLCIKPDGIYVDLTFGGGGHSREILKRLNKGKLLGFDQDADAERNILDDRRFIFVRHNFRFLKNFLRYYGIEKVDGILGDFGVSSHQFDEAERGFSFRVDARMDMRMNRKAEFSALNLLKEYSEEKLFKVFKEYGEINNAKKLTALITNYRRTNEICRTQQFVDLIKPLVPEKTRNKYLAKVFQALRYEVTGEIKSLKELLLQTPDVIKNGGMISLISYNSIEDRLVKNFFKYGKLKGDVEKDIYGNFSTPFKTINNKVIVPNEVELKHNPRSRSAKLRIAERI